MEMQPTRWSLVLFIKPGPSSPEAVKLKHKVHIRNTRDLVTLQPYLS